MLVWLPVNVARASGRSNILSSGGNLVLVDIHPFVLVNAWDRTQTQPYFANIEALGFDDAIGEYVTILSKSKAAGSNSNIIHPLDRFF